MLMRDLLAGDGSIYVHCDWRVSAYVRLALDEVFGNGSFTNEIIWRRAFAHNDPTRCGNIHDSLFYYSKTERRGVSGIGHFKSPVKNTSNSFSISSIQRGTNVTTDCHLMHRDMATEAIFCISGKGYGLYLVGHGPT